MEVCLVVMVFSEIIVGITKCENCLEARGRFKWPHYMEKTYAFLTKLDFFVNLYISVLMGVKGGWGDRRCCRAVDVLFFNKKNSRISLIDSKYDFSSASVSLLPGY
jgi:hypothetical protein